MEGERFCYGCMTSKPLSAYYAGVRTRCKECHKRNVRASYAENRAARSEYERKRYRDPERRNAMKETMRRHRQNNPDKYKARTAVGNALRDGRLVRGPCGRCGSTVKVQAHHADYSRPLEVSWVCWKCHREEEHGQTVTVQVPRR